MAYRMAGDIRYLAVIWQGGRPVRAVSVRYPCLAAQRAPFTRPDNSGPRAIGAKLEHINNRTESCRLLPRYVNGV